MGNSKTEEGTSGCVGTDWGEQQATKAEGSAGAGLREAFNSSPSRWDVVLRATRAFEGSVPAQPGVHCREKSRTKSPSCPVPYLSGGGQGTGSHGQDSEDTQFLKVLDK